MTHKTNVLFKYGDLVIDKVECVQTGTIFVAEQFLWLHNGYPFHTGQKPHEHPLASGFCRQWKRLQSVCIPGQMTLQ